MEISSLDLHYVIKELKVLEGAKVDKIVQPSKSEVVFQFYVTGKEKQILKIALPNIIFLSSKKPGTPEKLFGFCSALRKYLSNSRLESIEQLGSERIAKLVFKTKDDEFIVFVELFAQGNAVLCRKDLKIIVPLTAHKFKGREIKAGAKYSYPKRDVDFFKLIKSSLKNILEKSKNTVSKALAVDFGFGGVYAREICLLSGIKEGEKTVSDDKISALLKSIKLILAKEINPFVVEGEKPSPFELETDKGVSKELKKSFNSAIEEVVEAGTKKKLTKNEKELQKLQKIINMQERKITELQSSAEENKRKGELIYEKYQLLTKVLEDIIKARKTHSWKEIKERTKGHVLIKEVNEKTGEVVLEL